MPAGNYQIDMLLANVCKQNVTRFPYEIARLAEDIAGGLMVTMPSAQDLADEKIGPIVEKYLVGPVRHARPSTACASCASIENLTLGAGAVGYRTESHARRRLAAGAAHHDRAPVQHRTTRRSWPRRWPASASRGTRRSIKVAHGGDRRLTMTEGTPAEPAAREGRRTAGAATRTSTAPPWPPSLPADDPDVRPRDDRAPQRLPPGLRLAATCSTSDDPGSRGRRRRARRRRPHAGSELAPTVTRKLKE